MFSGNLGREDQMEVGREQGESSVTHLNQPWEGQVIAGEAYLMTSCGSAGVKLPRSVTSLGLFLSSSLLVRKEAAVDKSDVSFYPEGFQSQVPGGIGPAVWGREASTAAWSWWAVCKHPDGTDMTEPAWKDGRSQAKVPEACWGVASLSPSGSSALGTDL